MRYLLLPTTKEPFYEAIYTLDGVRYIFNFKYNQREDRYYFDLLTETGTVLARGLKVAAGVDIFQIVAGTTSPKGPLVVVYGTQLKDPGEGELGIDEDLSLLYGEPT